MMFVRTVLGKELDRYKYLTKEEQEKASIDEINKEKDQCEKDLECIQDKEIKTNTMETNKFYWRHEDKVAEAEGKIVTADRDWTQGFIPESQENSNSQTKQPIDTKSPGHNAIEALTKSLQARAAVRRQSLGIKEENGKKKSNNNATMQQCSKKKKIRRRRWEKSNINELESQGTTKS